MTAYFLLFHTIHDVLRAEKILKTTGCSFELVPVPRNLSSDCGSCIKISADPQDIVAHLNDIEVDRCFREENKIFTQLDVTG